MGVLLLPELRWSAAAERWRRVELLGFDHAWTYDHLAWQTLRDEPWFSAVPTLAAASSVTSRLRLGTLVASPNFRHPVPFAREIVTLDDVSGGRLTVGLGAGGLGWDTTMLGQDPWSAAERADRFVEFVDMLDELLRSPRTTFEGRFWRAVEARTSPGCVQSPRVPFAIAATAVRSMAVAARYAAIWVTNGDRHHHGPPLPPNEGAKVVARQLARLEQACEDADRDPASVDRLVLTGPRLDAGLTSAAAFADVVDAYASIGITDLVVHWPRAADPYHADEAILDDIAPLRPEPPRHPPSAGRGR